jgi:hypothetical protein
MDSLRFLEPSYWLMLPVLNLSGHRTCLSYPTRARNPLFPTGAISSARDCRGGDGVLSLRRLRSSMTLQWSSQSRPYSHAAQFWVMHRRTSCSGGRRFGLVDDAGSLRARLARSLSPAVKVPSGESWSTSLRRQGLPPQPLAEPGQQEGSHRAPCDGWSA